MDVCSKVYLQLHRVFESGDNLRAADIYKCLLDRLRTQTQPTHQLMIRCLRRLSEICYQIEACIHKYRFIPLRKIQISSAVSADDQALKYKKVERLLYEGALLNIEALSSTAESSTKSAPVSLSNSQRIFQFDFGFNTGNSA